jgi:hypothetical protein
MRAIKGELNVNLLEVLIEKLELGVLITWYA